MGVSTLILAGATTLVVTLGLMAAIRSRFVRGRLAFTAWLLLGFAGLEVAAAQGLGDVAAPLGTGAAAFVLGVVNLVGLAARQSVARSPALRSLPGDRPGRRRHRLVPVIATVLLREQLLDHVGGRRGRRRLRAAGHARQLLRRARDPDREAVPRRPLDRDRRQRRAGRRRSPGARPSCGPRTGSS